MAKILIVDDSAAIRVLLVKPLEAKGHQIVEGSDGVIGLDMFKQNKDFDLIISDINMPNMDGITMCQEINKVTTSESRKKIPILMLTTESTADVKAKGREVGVIAWITKPFDVNKVLSALDTIIPK